FTGFVNRSMKPIVRSRSMCAGSGLSDSPTTPAPSQSCSLTIATVDGSVSSPVKMMMSGFSRLSAARMSSSGETRAVSTPSRSSSALMRTAGSTSCKVRRTFTAGSEVVVGDESRRRVLEPVGAEHGDGVVDDRLERGEAIAHAGRRPWQIYNECSLTDSGHAARQGGPRERLERQRPNPLGDTGSVAVDRGARRFGSHVAGGEAGAAGGEHEVGLVGVRPCGKRGHYRSRLIGHDAA